MSHFYGYLWGGRGKVHRTGTKNSGINAHLRSWDNNVYVYLEADKKNGEDVLIVSKPNNLRMFVNGDEIKNE